MQFQENIGQFYLGQAVDNAQSPILYDAKDLTTHAVIIGMTGSGKTGLGICLLEEALLDHIPVIAVDPKGDLGNLLLTFPKLQPSDFKPYIDVVEADQTGKSINELAAEKAALWTKGLINSGQSRERIQTLRDRAEFNLFTPGAVYGRPISLLKSLTAPNKVLRDDKDLYRERIASATTGILTLLGLDNDPLAREYILISQILEYYWDNGQAITLKDLIVTIQTPPFEHIGVMDIETVYPAKDRLKLAMQLNALLSSPNFAAWTQGEPLDTVSLLFKNGKPQLSVMNIAHLSDNERMFFMTMLLNDILAWMRTQSGTGSLRAILYIDELFGYMPPTANPASKTLLLTLLKQARAYGLGLVLSTQNPVDLDYKGLSNTGTWFIGKLQTEQDRERVMSGLLSATKTGLNKAQLDECFNQLGKRIFLMHNIHENTPEIFTTRWAMSYLAGPLTRKQIDALTEQTPSTVINEIDNTKRSSPKHDFELTKQVSVPTGIDQYTLPITQMVTNPEKLVYRSQLLALCEVCYQDNMLNEPLTQQLILTVPFADSAIPVDWRDATEQQLEVNLIHSGSPEKGQCLQPMTVALRKEHYKDWERSLLQWLRQSKPLTVFYFVSAKLASRPDEDESTFRQRLTLTLHEQRDEKIANLRKKLDAKLNTLESKLVRAQQKIEKEAEQASGKNIDAIIGVGSALLGAFLGRKTVSRTNARSLGTAVRKVTRAFDERKDIDRAKVALTLIEEDIKRLEDKFLAESQAIQNNYNIDSVKLDILNIYPKANDIHVQLFGLGWQPGVIKDDEWRAI